MSNEIITAEAVDKTYEVAIALHERIMASGSVAASALVEMCRGLKQMRDDRLYSALGHDSFDSYCEDRAGIKARQAYNYIAVFERLGEDKLLNHASVGVTKLELISRLPFGERDEVLNKATEDGMSASEIKKLLEENKKQGEQISMLEEQLAAAEEGPSATPVPTEDEINARIAEVRAQVVKEYDGKISALEKKIAETPDEDDLRRRITKEVTDKQKASMEKKIDAAVKKKLEAAVTEKVEAAKKEAQTAAEGKYKAELDELRAAVDKSAGLNKELQDKPKNSDSSHVSVKIYFNATKESFNSACDLVKGMEGEDKEKYKAALTKLLEVMKNTVDNI